MKKIVVPCDNCKKKFVVKKPKVKTHKDAVEGILKIYYIECKHCKKKFVSFVENEKIKTMVKNNKILQNDLRNAKDDNDYIKLLEESEKNLKKIKSVKKDLIFRFSKYV